MKKIKGFTILEMILVIAIIGIISTSLMNAKRNVSGNIDTRRDAVNIIHKEIDQYLKDFQRNKIYESGDNIYEIDAFRILFGNEIPTKTGSSLTIGNFYKAAGYFNSGTLISGQKYSAFQYLKGSDNYTFYTRNKKGTTIYPIWISNNGKIYTGTSIDPIATELQTSEYQFVICGGNGGNIEHIGAITINAVTKESRLDRCESEKYGGIKCNNIFEAC